MPDSHLVSVSLEACVLEVDEQENDYDNSNTAEDQIALAGRYNVLFARLELLPTV